VACTDDAARHCGLERRERLARTLAGELDAIVAMAMRAEPERRYSSAESLADDVQRFLKRMPVVARPDTLGYRLRRFVARRRAVVAIGAAATLTGATFLGVAIWQARSARAEGERTRRISAFMQSTLGAADASNVGGAGLRLGPNVTIAVLLDSTLQRIPAAFPDDPAIRARLYTSLGSSLLSQGRLREAAAVLDSAVRLAEESYGTSSETYALASIEAGVVALHRNRLDDAARFIDHARASLERAGQSHSEMYARALVEQSSVDLVRGDYTAIAPLANRALALETARTPGPSVVKAAALNRLAGVAVSRGALSSADSLLRQSLTMLDALHVPFTLERIDVLSNLSLAAWATGRIATADSFSQRGLRQATLVFGADSREAALFLRHSGLVRLARGDTATARVQLTRAVHVIDSIPEVVAPIRHLVHDGYFSYLLAAMRLADADSVAAAELSHMSGRDRGFELALAHFNYGYTRAMLHDLPTSETQLRLAEALYRSSGIVNVLADTLIRANLGAVYLRMGRSEEARRYLQTLSPQQRQDITAFAARTHGADSAAAAARERRSEGR
ncbi:MAG: tetratricopeptide repeat protein, partial [Gemmatimonadota bacterium]